jgi:hypothetical protein
LYTSIDKSLLLTFAQAALRGKIAPDEAEDEGCGGPTTEDDNEVWRDFRRNPGPPARIAGMELEGLGPVFLISVSLVARRFPIFVAPCSWN